MIDTRVHDPRQRILYLYAISVNKPFLARQSLHLSLKNLSLLDPEFLGLSSFTRFSFYGRVGRVMTSVCSNYARREKTRFSRVRNRTRRRAERRVYAVQFYLCISRPPDIFCLSPANALPGSRFINLSAVAFELYSPCACVERGEAEVSLSSSRRWSRD